MNRETIKKTVSLFLNCQKLIVKPKRLHYSDLKCLFGNTINEDEFKNIVKSIFNLADHYFLLEKYQHPTKLLIEINALADSVRLNMNPHQKLTFLTLIIKLIKYNHQEDNSSLERAFFCIAEIFSYNITQSTKLKKMFTTEEPGQDEYIDSLLITNEQPDYRKVIDGLKVHYNSQLPFKIWVYNIKSVNNLMFKILDLKDDYTDLEINKGDILTYNNVMQGILDEQNINLETLSSKITSIPESISTIKIPSTERSPRIVLNSLENKIEIEGVSMVNHPLNFFEPVFYWIEKIKEKNPKSLSLHLNLSFFNTYTSKIILKILQKVIEVESQNCKVKICWYYETDDEEIKEAGEHYASIVNRSFTYIATTPVDFISA
ncbi:DUF1987 domain-containing protein [Aurantibacillus circumpalustris]|uniref:DUF1987 domain-containing protein n=1 Tax=Aurantibacillus circumpalustris TaxID=3036359 RepID=UPI00295BC938|nr:DUF1987 domain-containing protein [Aurantibacillus circumpalustris]